MRVTAQTGRKFITAWGLVIVGLTLYGCSSGPDVQTTTPLAEPLAFSRDTVIAKQAPPPPPVVPVGVDTAFVVAADEAFGVVLDRDTLTVLAEESRQLDLGVQVVDTLGAVARFVQHAVSGDDRYAMSPADSQVVGRLLLRDMAGTDANASLVLGLDDALVRLDSLATAADAMGKDLAWGSEDPTRLAQSRDVKVAILGFGARSSNLRKQLGALQGNLAMTSQAADSARTQQEISQLVREFGSDLDTAINEMGRAAQSVTAGSLSPTSLRGLQGNLEDRRGQLMEFEARWAQFENTGSLDMANPDKGFNSEGMRKLLKQMESDLAYLAQLAWQKATALDAAQDFQAELAARREAETYVQRTQETLMELKKRNRNLVGAYGRLATRYWQGRLDQVAQDQQDRESLYAQLEKMVAEAGGTSQIRQDADLLAAYRRASDRLLQLRRAHLDKVDKHDGLRESVRANLASDLYNRARVLGDAEDYAAAMATYAELAAEQPGEYPWYYQLASLSWSQSREPWAWADSVNTGPTSRTEAARWLDQCEQVLLERYQFDQDMDQAKAVLKGEASLAVPVSDTSAPSVRAAQFQPRDRRWYYGRHVQKAGQDLTALGDAANDKDVRRWLLNIEILRKRLAFDSENGDAFLYRYARQAILSDDITPAAARQVLEHWSWDDGHLSLRRRWAAVSQLPDSTEAAAAVKRDSLTALLAEARTVGVERQINWSIGSLEFLKLEQYDAGLQRMHGLLKEVEAHPTPYPEVGAIDSTVVAVYPVFLYNRGTFYQQDGLRREAFYCFLGVAEEYAWDLRTASMARYSAASLLADGNKRGALKLVRTAITEALRVIGDNPADFDLNTLVAMYELRQNLAGELGLFQEAVAARDEARQLRGIADQAALSVNMQGEVGP